MGTSYIKFTLTFSIFLLFSIKNISLAQNVSINTTGNPADNSAGLEVDFPDKGLLIPRVNLTATNNPAPIIAPADALLVYNLSTAGTTPNNVTPGYYYWANGRWNRLLAGSDDGKFWKTDGNQGTNTATNFLGTTDNVSLTIRTNNIERFRITNANQVHGMSLGTAASPFYSWSSNSNTGMWSSSGLLRFSVSGAERLRIGTSYLRTTFNGTATAPAYSFTTNSNVGMYRAATDALGFSTNGIERYRVNAAGQFLINTTTPTEPNLFEVKVSAGSYWSTSSYNTTIGGGAGFFTNSNGSNGYNALEATTAGSNSGIWGWNQASGVGVRGLVTMTSVGWAGYFQGDVGATGVYISSDERWKKNIRSIETETSETVLSKIMQIQPKKYEWKADEFPGMGFDPKKVSYGFIAQELEKIFPDLVNSNKVIPNPTREHKSRAEADNVTGYYMVDYIGLIPILTAGIKEQQGMIDSQNERIKQLEQIVKDLQQKLDK
ncbi:MAG: tail fiber domain-containing protein [Brumimicrobium sp.]